MKEQVACRSLVRTFLNAGWTDSSTYLSWMTAKIQILRSARTNVTLAYEFSVQKEVANPSQSQTRSLQKPQKQPLPTSTRPIFYLIYEKNMDSAIELEVKTINRFYI